MVMYPLPRSSSAGMRSIRRELQRRRPTKPLAPRSSIAKKPSAPPRRDSSSDAVRDPRSRSPHWEAPSSNISIFRSSAGTDVSPQPRPQTSSRCKAASPPPPPPRRGSSDAVRDPRPRSPHREVPSSNISISGRSAGTDASSQPRPQSSSRCKAASPPPPPPRRGSSDAVLDPRPRSPHKEVPSSNISISRGSAGTDASAMPRVRASCNAASPPPPPPRSAPSSVRSACQDTPGVSETLTPGTVVGVRTRTTTLKTGQVLVLWLKATVVSSTDEGYEVVYDDKRPPSDPKSTVCVARHHVRMIKPSPSMTTPPPASLPLATATKKKEMLVVPAPTKTTAGKSVRLIRSLMPEMERQARADSGFGF